jgi:hypothetical protein
LAVAYLQETTHRNHRLKAGSSGGKFMSGLGEFHHAEEVPTKGSKITHWVILAAVVAGMLAFAASWGMFNPDVKQTAQSYPRAL